jgi:hypothetical protein
MEFERHPTASQPVLGSICLFLGTALLTLSVAHEAAGLPFRMPLFWYHNRPLQVSTAQWGYPGYPVSMHSVHCLNCLRFPAGLP